MIVEVYWNSIRKLWSVRHEGRVIYRRRLVNLSDCEFVVYEAGRERVRWEKRKNVHAFVRGKLLSEDAGMVVSGDNVSYNPYKNDTFVRLGEPVFSSQRVTMTIENDLPKVLGL